MNNNRIAKELLESNKAADELGLPSITSMIMHKLSRKRISTSVFQHKGLVLD